MARQKPDDSIQPKVFFKNAREFRHDLYKLEVTKMKKNTSWKKFEPLIVELEHAHIYHSHNNRGAQQTHCTAVGGHFHEVHPRVMPDGSMKAECGPPLREVKRKTKSGKIQTIIEPVAWTDGDNGDRQIIDNHRHDVTYQGSELLTTDKINAIRSDNQSSLNQMGVRAPELKQQQVSTELTDISVD